MGNAIKQNHNLTENTNKKFKKVSNHSCRNNCTFYLFCKNSKEKLKVE